MMPVARTMPAAKKHVSSSASSDIVPIHVMGVRHCSKPKLEMRKKPGERVDGKDQYVPANA